MRRLSLNARLAFDAPASAEIEVALFLIEHPDLDAPIRLSTDNTERLSVDPLTYGTRSTWRGANPVTDPYLWIVASAVLPGDDDEAPASARLVIENLDAGLTALLRSFTEPPTISIAVVLADSPDTIEAEWTGLQLASADITAAEITLTLSRDEIELEPFPPGRMTRLNFPGLHP
ncbi:hypothetical protein [Pararhodobacter zhoushanensis]|uniref:DUF1833 domain-containing protein n=1 Tax=Pararhodobacter zhoushanensis TaxID=2479545 RepID=A0ABT3H363_9RHOB|nr:hypothetical protein [Pararhodobacter zhoushanensis]MCW1934125.1 hypothetical protein [Pararhodobacter zhoushanensis]